MNGTSGKKDILTILALCALIAVLVAAVIGIFGYLDTVVPESAKWSAQEDASVSAPADVSGPSADEDAPRFCPSCGKELHEGFQWGQFCPYCGQKVE